MTALSQQRGATLIVSMIMLIVITVLVAYSIRAGNTNLRIAGNMQRQAEASMAAQQAIEQVIEQIKTVDNITLIPAQNISVSNAGASYAVATNSLGAVGACILEVPVANDQLNPSNADDVPCFQSQDADKAISSSGTVTATPSACKQQYWEIRATAGDASGGSGVQHTQVQGITMRVNATVNCP